MKKQPLLILLLISALLASAASGKASYHNLTGTNSTNDTNDTYTPPPAEEDQPEPEEPPKIDFSVTKFVPSEFKVGDVQFNMQVWNIGNVELEDLIALVSGKGFSTYSIIPIDRLSPGQSSYSIVMGNFKEQGNITLMIKIKDKTFYKKVEVIDPNYISEEEKQRQIEEQRKAEEEAKNARQARITNLTNELKILESNYTQLETLLNQKKAAKYDVSEVSLADLKDLLREARADIITENLAGAMANLDLAKIEQADQRNKLDNAQIIKVSILNLIRNNLLLISSVAAAIITLFTFYEFTKKKQQQLRDQVKTTANTVRARLEDKRKRDAEKAAQKKAAKEAEKKGDRPAESEPEKETAASDEKKHAAPKKSKRKKIRKV